MFNGDWQNAGYDKDLPGNVGFFVFPPAEAGGKLAAMSAPLTYGIAAKAKNADCAAFFLNWVATNDKAREIDVAVGGSNPGGPPDLPIPPVAAGSVTNETLAAGAEVAQGQRRDGLHRQRDRLDLRPGLDARAPEAGRRQAGRRRPAQGRPGEYEKELAAVTPAADRARSASDAIAPALGPALVGGSPADPLDPGGPPADASSGWLFVAAGPRRSTRCSSSSRWS